MKGLIFSEPMVKVWLEGNKTVTRRLMNPQPLERSQYGGMNIYGQAIFYPPDDLEDTDDSCLRKPRYLPGETVYIKETWAHVSVPDGTTARKNIIVYKADNPQGVCVPNMWKSPRFMPERFSRSHALIVSVRPERVKEIGFDELLKEGLEVDTEARYVFNEDGVPIDCYPEPDPSTLLDQFVTLWESLHPGSWERNDWVWRNELEWRER